MLSGVEPPVTKQEAVRATVRLLKLDGASFEKILEIRATGNDKSSLSEHEANDLFASYLTQLESVIETVDKMAEHLHGASA